ncbi:MAG TPA: sigma-70 family RNA polymerase sigma factor [Gemmata sp.]
MPTLTHLAAQLTRAPDPRTDAQLVAAFLADANQGAFAELVRRHGPTVLGVCRRFLGPTPDAEDAFQATFLVLIRRARSTEWRAALGPWLYGVALRVARKARAVRAKRHANERAVPAMSEPTTAPDEPDDTGAVLDEELAALPAPYRLPLVLCEIQGTSRRDAARALGLAEGTLSSRLARGRKMLRTRLARRGVVPALTGLAVTVPAALATATVRNAVHVLAHTAGAVPGGILFLTEGVTKAMIVKWKLALVVVACVALTGFGAWRSSAQPAPRGGAPVTPAEMKPSPSSLVSTDPNPPVEIVARVGADKIITKRDVLGAMYQTSEVNIPPPERRWLRVTD